jgi:3-hydroxyisobutyrate dehydrogenase
MRIGFVGLGNMGVPMAAHLAKGGHALVVFDIDMARAEQFAQANGAKAASDLNVVGAADIVITMLPTGKDVRQAIVEAQGGALLKALRPGSVVIDMSSSEPVGTQQLGAELASRKAVLIDAPVSGGVVRAKSGTLAIMIGCDDAKTLAAVRPVLSLMGDRLFETGGLGTGHAMKALNNFVAASSFAATAEAMMIGAAFGLDRGKMVDIMNVSTGRNFHTDVVMKEHVVGGKFATGFAVGLLAKDVKIAEELGEAVKIEAPLTKLVSRRWAEARDKVGATRDNTEAYLAWAGAAAGAEKEPAKTGTTTVKTKKT